jgi:hypothetical protein
MYGNGASLLSFFSTVARALPEVVVIVAGLVVVLGRRAIHPKASARAALGLAILLAGRLASAAFYAGAPALAGASLAALYAAAGLVFSLLHAAALGLLVAAVVADRAPGGPAPVRLTSAP